MMLKGPGIPMDATYREMVSGMDFAPTFLAAAGIPCPQDQGLDGTDLIPYLTRKDSDAPHDVLFWCNRMWDGPFQHQHPHNLIHNQAMRKGDWKAVRYAVPDNGTPERSWELYDLSVDIGEQHNLAPEYPELVKEFDSQFASWLSEMPEPLEKN